MQLMEIRHCSEDLHSCSMFSECSVPFHKIMTTNKWATSRPIQLSTKVWVKLLLLLENALKLNFEAL